MGPRTENLTATTRLSSPFWKGTLSMTSNSSSAFPVMQKLSHLAKPCTYFVLTLLDYLMVETSMERSGQNTALVAWGSSEQRELSVFPSHPLLKLNIPWFCSVHLHFLSRELLADSSSLSPRIGELWYQKWPCSFQWCWTPLLKKAGGAHRYHVSEQRRKDWMEQGKEWIHRGL